MFLPKNPALSIAVAADVPHITSVLNSAYRGEMSRQGWTTEADLIAGNVRTDEKHLLEVMQKKGSIVLKYTDGSGSITGCVNLQQTENKLYLGMLAVVPVKQNSGVGKALLQAAEEFAGSTGCSVIYMTVISLRTELIEWYKRHGYIATGETIPFPEDGLTGAHLRELEFIVLHKKV